jgi:hypothetical protein
VKKRARVAHRFLKQNAARVWIVADDQSNRPVHIGHEPMEMNALNPSWFGRPFENRRAKRAALTDESNARQRKGFANVAFKPMRQHQPTQFGPMIRPRAVRIWFSAPPSRSTLEPG